jgi:two-component system alkaline phosphatase synthesis response regulator PhoP
MARILVVDDEASLLKLLEIYLKRFGHDVICCTTGTAGLSLLDDPLGTFDLAVLDHSLPDMEGSDLLQTVLGKRPQMPVLISSGSFLDIEHLPVPPGRRVGFLQKPYMPKAIGDAVEALLNGQTGATA